MTWPAVLWQGLLDGLMLGLCVGGIVALAIGMWILGPVLLGAAVFVLSLCSKAREHKTS